MTLAKGLGNGLPIGAMLTRKTIAAAMTPGSHASTFGGNPVACAAAVATLQVLLSEGFLAGVRARSTYFQARLQELAENYPELISTVRGMGLILGLVLTEKGVALGAELVTKMFERGYLLNFAGGVALRFVPPLVVSKAEIDQLVTALAGLLAEYRPA